MAAHKVYRDAVTGEWVTEEYAAQHPDTTVAETVTVTLYDEPGAHVVAASVDNTIDDGDRTDYLDGEPV